MRTIAWLIPRLIDGSGGHRTMLQHAFALEKAGHCCRIYIEGEGQQSTASEAVEKMFGYHFEHVRFGWNDIPPADMAVATIWYSAALVRDLPFECIRTYFVQDYEAMFNPMGDGYLMAENSYRYGLTPVTIGRWLRHELGEKFQVKAFHFDFGANLTVYKPLEDQKREEAICFIYQPDKPRRCSRLGIEALGIVKHYRPSVKIYLYGSHLRDKGHIWFEHEHMGLLNLNDCNALYNRCSLGLCLSSSNPSRIPFEMMASGLPVVEFWRPNNLYDMPQDAVSLSDCTPEGIAENILRLLDDTQARNRMAQAGVKFMQTRPLHIETDQFVSIVRQMFSGEKPHSSNCEPMYHLPPVVAGSQMETLPAHIRKRLTMPANARFNSLPAPIRIVLAYGARKVRKLIANN